MKAEKVLKITLVILFIILISLISFGGIFVQKTKFINNIMPEYKLGADLTGSRNIVLAVNEENEEVLTKENYAKAKEIIEKRIQKIQKMDNGLNQSKAVDYYTIKQDEKDGKIFIQLPENDYTNMVAQYSMIKGDFSVTDEEGKVLLNNSHIEKGQVAYQSTENGTVVGFVIQFNEEGTQILKDITNTYVKTVDEEGNETTKTVDFKIDSSTILNTYFEEEISNGIIQFSMGKVSNSTSEIATYAQDALNLETLLNNGNLPLTYGIEENRYVMSDITQNMLGVSAIVVGSILILGIIFLIVKYRKNGILGAISLIGYLAILLIAIRLFNVVITLEGIAGLIFAIILDYGFILYLLSLIKNNKVEVNNNFRQALYKFLFVIIPIAIVTVIFTMTEWNAIASFGMTNFWGIILIMLYNWLITKTLIVSSTKR